MSLLGVVISFIALGIAGLALGWNIYRDYTCHSKVRIYAEIKDQPKNISTILKGKYIAISVVNQGPHEVEIETLWAANISFFRKALLKGYGVLLHPVANFQLPNKINPGETIELLVPFHEDCFLKDRFTNLGVMDCYDREHWVKKTELWSLYREYKKSFSPRPQKA